MTMVSGRRTLRETAMEKNGMLGSIVVTGVRILPRSGHEARWMSDVPIVTGLVPPRWIMDEQHDDDGGAFVTKWTLDSGAELTGGRLAGRPFKRDIVCGSELVVPE